MHFQIEMPLFDIIFLAMKVIINVIICPRLLTLLFCYLSILSVAQTPTDGLVAYYPFNGNANDESGNGHHGMVNGASLMDDRFGNENGAYEFNGLDNYIALDDVIGNIGTADYTISCWILISGMDEENTVFGKRDASSYGNFYQFGTGTGKIGYEINESSFTDYSFVEGETIFNQGEWYHIAIKREQLTTYIYVNGVAEKIETLPMVHDINNTAIAALGARFDNTDPIGFFQGLIDEVYFYNRSLTDEEIKQLGGFTYSDTQLAILEPFRGNPQSDIVYEFNRTNWYYLAYTKSADGSGAVFINGDEIGKLQWNNDAYNHAKLNIATHYFTSYDQFFSGSIDEIKVSNIAKNNAEIKQYFDSNLSFQEEASTLQIWKFDEGAGNEFYNIDNDLTGNLYGAPQWVDGKFGKAVDYDGIDDRGDVIFDLPENTFTYEMWVRFDGDLQETGQTIIQPYGLNNTQYTVKLYIPQDPIVQFSLPNAELLENESTLLPVSVQNFQNILTTQYTISWDPAVLQYQGVQDFGLRDLDAGDFFLFEPGKLTLSWNPADLQPESVDDNTTIFTLDFLAIGQGGQQTDILFSDDPTPKEVSDGNGNILEANYTNGIITIMDEVVLGGYIKTQKGEPLVGIEVELNGSMELNTTTDEFGWYSFSVQPNQEYHIAPLFDTDADDGISTLDIVIMHWHILGKKYMMSNYDLIACDVNGSKSLTTLDLAETRAVVLHSNEKFRDRNAVEFINNEYTGNGDIFEYKNYLDIIPTQSHLDLNYTAVKIGDAGQNWKANKNNGAREHLLDELDIIIEKGEIAGNKVNIPLKSTEFKNIIGLQFTMEWDPHVYEFERLLDHQLHFDANLNLVKDGQLTVVWSSKDLEGLTLDAKTILTVIEFSLIDESKDPEITITSGITPAFAYNSNLEAMMIKGNSITETNLFANNLIIYPNPAVSHITIMGIAPGEARYSILTPTGNLVLQGEAGNQQIHLENLAKGIYILQLTDSGNQVINQKFIKQ